MSVSHVSDSASSRAVSDPAPAHIDLCSTSSSSSPSAVPPSHSDDSDPPPATTSKAVPASSSQDEAAPSRSGPPRKRRGRRYALPEDRVTPSLARERNALFAFWGDTHVLDRKGPPLDESTLKKRWERIRCFLGYLYNQGTPMESLGLKYACGNETRIEAYLTYLQDDRGLRASTRAEHATAIVTVLKFLEVKEPGLERVRRKVMNMRNEFLRYKDPKRSGTWQELREKGKWLHWEEVLHVARAQRRVVEDMLATGTASSRTGIGKGRGSKRRRRAVSDVRIAEAYRAMLILDFYTLMPPGRALEYREMRLGEDLVRRKGKDGTERWWLTTSKYKNRRFRGKDDTDLSLVAMLVEHLEEYLEDHRPVLLRNTEGDDVGYVFLNVHGEPYSSAAWSVMLTKVFKRLGNQKVSVNMLRSAFVTHDRRTAADRKKAALAYAYKLANAE